MHMLFRSTDRSRWRRCSAAHGRVVVTRSQKQHETSPKRHGPNLATVATHTAARRNGCERPSLSDGCCLLEVTRLCLEHELKCERAAGQTKQDRALRKAACHRSVDQKPFRHVRLGSIDSRGARLKAAGKISGGAFAFLHCLPTTNTTPLRALDTYDSVGRCACEPQHRGRSGDRPLRCVLFV